MATMAKRNNDNDLTFKGQRLPTAFGTRVLMRHFQDNEKGFAAFLEDYENAKLTARGSMEPSDKQYDIADLKLQGFSTSEIAEKKSVTNSQVSQAIHRVAVWQFLGNKRTAKKASK